MKYIIFLFLVSSFIACNSGSRSSSTKNNVNGDDGLGVTTTVWNNTTINLRVKKAGVEVLKLKKENVLIYQVRSLVY